MSDAMQIKAPRSQRGRGSKFAGEKPRDLKGSTRKLFKKLAAYKAKIFAVVIFTVLGTVFKVLGPRVLGNATDELARGVSSLLSGSGGGIDFESIGRILFMLALLYIFNFFFNFLQIYIMSGLSADISMELRREISVKMNRLPVSYYNRASYGDVLSRITNDVDTINTNLNQTMTQSVSAVATLLGISAMMLSISFKMTLVAYLSLAVSVFLISVLVKFSQKYFRAQQSFLGAVNGQVEEKYGAHLIIKAFNGEEREIEDFSRINDRLYKAGRKAGFMSGIMQPVMQFVGNLGYVAVCILGAGMAIKGEITVGGIQAFIHYIRHFSQPVVQIAQISNQFQSVLAASERVFEFLDEKEEEDGEPLFKTEALDIKGDVCFEHVCFAYEGSDKPVIKDFSAKIKAGMKVAVVGETGAGKTTLVKLLMRFHDLKGGRILLDGRDISAFSRRDLRSQFAMVLQDTWLCAKSVRENIRYGRLSASDEEVRKAAAAAQVDRFIRTLPYSYDTEINEEADNVSAGQKQLITIARALLKDSKILILDEATSSVDTRTEELMSRATDNLTAGRTSFIIAHRLSTIRNADLIRCIEDGDIAEQGTHEELMQKNGYYARLYNAQFDSPSALSC